MAALSQRNLQPLCDVVVCSFVAKLKSDRVGLSLLIKWHGHMRDDDNLPFTMRGSFTHVSWLGSHIESVIAAITYSGYVVPTMAALSLRNLQPLSDVVVCSFVAKLNYDIVGLSLLIKCQEITQGVRSSTRVGRLAKERLHKVPAEPPDWNDEFKDPKLLLVVDMLERWKNEASS
ncbi:hypothetical protein Tco_0226501 [Tanacetum coccineum]